MSFQREVRSALRSCIRASRFFSLVGATLVVALPSTQGRPQGSPLQSPPLPDSCLKESGASTQIRSLLQTLETHPTAEAYNTVGALWARDRKYDCAIAAFDAALRLDPTVWERTLQQGPGAHLESELQQAVTELRLAVKEKPGSFAAHNALGRALRSLGQLAEATEEFKKALGLNPRFVDASLNLADIALDQKRYVAAAYYVQQALAKSPPQPFSDRLEMDLALAYSGNQEYEKSAGVFQEAGRRPSGLERVAFRSRQHLRPLQRMGSGGCGIQTGSAARPEKRCRAAVDGKGLHQPQSGQRDLALFARLRP